MRGRSGGGGREMVTKRNNAACSSNLSFACVYESRRLYLKSDENESSSIFN